ncbi:uncharacterized protein B0H64DRAFT_364874 [Chaetomium fimeti]|uniref:AB hydrolase-1 domain-containing protein n=1 Tax=Chaetomium fimeti TaxID=1854472 RepID=A0AAE0H979_9PEZI|nr:hypothetical protein B0H64DRAFT_364874 [Chaetomium fimeti]
MRRFFCWRPKAAATGPAAEQDPSGQSVATASASPSTKTFPTGIKLLHSAAHATVDIVFVHGLTGDREKTWTAHAAPEPWPKALLPSELPTARVLTFGYDAYVADWRGVVSQNRIGNHAWNLLTSLATYRENDDTNERPVVFVCHSLGGLVCEDALVRSKERPEQHLQNIFRSTRGIAFLGTPHHGAGLARWAELLARSIGVIKQTNTEIVAVLKHESEVLARIQDSFHTMVLSRSGEGLQPIDISCFYEELPLLGIGEVVPQHSAILPGYIPIGIHSNHTDMARFVSADDPGFTAVCGELRRWIKQMDAIERRFGYPPASSPTHSPGDGQDGRTSSAVQFLVPYTSNPDFVGRSEILERLKSQLGHGQPLAGGTSQPIACLYGLGGIGKTQIAIAYAFWLRETHPEVSVFWIHASNAERFRRAYAWIAQECQIPGYDNPETDVLPLVKKWLEQKDGGRWLMVIDNADDMHVFFEQQTGPADASSSSNEGNFGRYVPECPNGAILVTTRNKQAGSRLTKGKRPIEVGKMDDDETVQLLRRRLDGVDAASSESSALSSRLEHLPLALVQAAAFIQENTITIGEYLQLMDKSDEHVVDLLSEDFETVGRDSETPRAVAETWILSFDQIQRQNAFAGKLLSLMSLFDRQAIPLEFLSRYSEQQGQEQRADIQLTKALGVLKAFCFAVEDKDHGFTMHRLVQLVTQKWLGSKGGLRQWAEQALLVVSEAYPPGNYENRAVCSLYLPHVYAVLKIDGTGSKGERMARASLLHRTARLFHYQGQWKDAEKFYEQATELRKAVLGEEHPSTLVSMGSLASTYWNQGRWKEAESLEIQVMGTRKRVLGEEHPDTLTGIANLASTYSDQGRWKEAESLEVQVMETRKRVLGEEHPDTLVSIGNLASIYRGQVRWKEAESLEVQVMETRKRVLGEEHPDTLVSIGNLAWTYRNQGRWKEAELLEVQVIETKKRVLGEEHPSILTSIANLASTYRDQGRWKEAELLEVQVMETRKRVLGEEHPSTLTSIANLASTYRDQGRWKEAELLEVQVMETRKRVLGEEHPSTLTSIANLASTYWIQGRWKEAEPLEVQVMETRKRVLGEEHPDALNSMVNLAYTWKSQNRLEDALDLMQTCFHHQQQVLGQDHPDTVSTLSILTRWREHSGNTVI